MKTFFILSICYLVEKFFLHYPSFHPAVQSKSKSKWKISLVVLFSFFFLFSSLHLPLIFCDLTFDHYRTHSFARRTTMYPIHSSIISAQLVNLDIYKFLLFLSIARVLVWWWNNCLVLWRSMRNASILYGGRLKQI